MVTGAFWLLVGVVVYVYVGYPALLAILSPWRRRGVNSAGMALPSVSVVIAARNEQAAIAAKLDNALSLDYPSDKLEIIVASDGSMDRTNAVVQAYRERGVSLVAASEHRGKSAVQNAAIRQARGEVLVFSDATGLYNREAIRRLVQHFGDDRIGCVTGLVEYGNGREWAASRGENAYWKYETFLRKRESELGLLLMASGSIMAVRRRLVEQLPDSVGEDFVIPLSVVARGLRVVLEPGARARERTAESASDLFAIKVRIISRDLRGLLQWRRLLNPLRYPGPFVSLISHKLLRWLVPFFLIVILASNLALVGAWPYDVLLALQAAFYSAAAVGALGERWGLGRGALGMPAAFCVVNLAALVGVLRVVTGRSSARWEPVR